MPNEFLYLQEHLSCRHYVSDYSCGFTYRNITGGDFMDVENRYNHLIFLTEGKLIVNCDEFANRHFKQGDLFFIPRAAAAQLTIVEDSKMIVCVFDAIKSICDKFNLHSCWSICKDLKYDFRSVRIIPQMEVFLNQLIYYLDQGVKCEHFHELKSQEMFLIFRWFYTREQLALLFYPIIGQSLDFKTFILDNHLKVKNINELSDLSMMGRSGFDVKFKKEFGMPPGQWLLKQKAKHIKIHMSMPGVTISDLLIKFDFNSATHFTRFCKQHFGCTPSKLMAALQGKSTGKQINTDRPV